MAAKKKDTRKIVKLYFKKSPPGWGYHAGHVHDVPEDVAKKQKFVKNGYAIEPTPVLPKDIPFRKELIAHGVETLGELEEVKDLKTIDGIAEKGEKQIAEYLKENA